MRLHLILPQVKPGDFSFPSQCPYADCKARNFKFLQPVIKPLRDSVYSKVIAHRYRCLSCGRTFRVYPKGVNRGQISLRVKGLAIMLYLLGLSYGAVSIALEALGIYMSKGSVYGAVQDAAKRVPGLKREEVFQGIKTPALGADVTSVKCKGKWLPLGISVDETSGIVLTLDNLSGEDTQSLKEWIEPIAKEVEAEVIVTDDADAFKQVADELGLNHQVCKKHVERNTEALIESLKPQVKEDKDGSLEEIKVSPEQAIADLDRLGELVRERRPEDEGEIGELYRRYLAARPPGKGEKASLAYRLKLFFLDRWNLWRRLTFYRKWRGRGGEKLDGTNNAAERAIGWWIKERYRMMRGYKREESAVNLSRLMCWAGNHLNCGGADLSLLMA